MTTYIKIANEYDKELDMLEIGFQIIRADTIRRIYVESYTEEGKKNGSLFCVCVECDNDISIRAMNYPDIMTAHKELDGLYQQITRKK